MVSTQQSEEQRRQKVLAKVDQLKDWKNGARLAGAFGAAAFVARLSWQILSGNPIELQSALWQGCIVGLILILSFRYVLPSIQRFL